MRRNVRTLRTQRIATRAAACLGLIAPCGLAARGATDTWDNSSGNRLWSTGINWADNSEPSSILDHVLFPTPQVGGGVVDLSAGEVAASITFDNTYLLQGGSLNILGSNGTVTVNNFRSATINSQLTGATGLNKVGNGLLQVGGTNTFTGQVNVSQGGLIFTANSNLGNVNNPIFIDSDGWLGTGGNVATSRSIATSMTGGEIRVINGTLTVNTGIGTASTLANPLGGSGAGTLVLAAASARTGPNSFGNGVVRLANAAGLGSGATSIANNGVLEIVAGTNVLLPVTLGFDGALRAFGGGQGVYGGTCTVTGSQVKLIGGTTASDVLRLGNAVPNVYTGGAGSKTTVTGPGAVYLLTANNYAGDWQVDSGTLRFINSGALGTGTTPVVVNNTGTLELIGVTFQRDVTLNHGATLAFDTAGQVLGQVAVGNAAAVTLALRNGGTEIFGAAANALTGGGSGGSVITVTTNDASGVLQLNQPSDYLGNWNITDEVKLEIDADENLGAGANSVSMNEATLRTTGTTTSSRLFTITGSSSIDVAAGTTFTMANGLRDGSGVLSKRGGGTLVSGDNSSRSGQIDLIEGTLAAEATNALGATSVLMYGGALEVRGVTIPNAVTMHNGTTLRGVGAAQVNGAIFVVTGHNPTIATAGAADVLTLGATVTSGGTGSNVTVAGPGKVVLTQPALYSGGWTVGGGILEISADNQLGAAANSVTLDGGALRAALTMTSSRAVFANGGGIEVATGRFLNLTGPLTSGANGGFTKSGSGLLAIAGAQTHAAGAVLNMNQGGVNLDSNAGSPAARNLTINVNAHLLAVNVTQNLKALNVAPGAAVRVTEIGDTVVLRTDSVSVTGTGEIDLKDNLLITASPLGSWNGSAYTGVAGLVDAGRGNAGNPLWDGSGIVTSDPRAINTGNRFSIGAARASDVGNVGETGTTLYAGQTVLGSDTLAVFTWGGDANLDGTINIDDYGRIDSNVAAPGANGWFNGDFNYDGKINIDDYGIIDTNIAAASQSQAPLSVVIGVATSARPGGVAAVPEPGAMLLLFGLAPTLRRRGRGRVLRACAG